MGVVALEDLDELRRSLAGAALVPSDPEYDAARVCFNALVDRRPEVIVRCVGARDVVSAFAFARAHELEVAVRGGGHNPAGHCLLDGGLVIDLSRMRRVELDAGAGIARAEGGATWADFDAATQAQGLATTGGAKAILEPDLGRLVPGAKADLVLYDLDATWWTPLNDIEQQLVFGEREDVESGSVVGCRGGRVVYGRFLLQTLQ